MNAWESGDIEANGVRLHYTRTGGGKPPLVLAHGFSDDGLCWTPIAEALESEYDVVMVDARCHGGSEAPEEPFDVTDQAADLAGAIAGLGLEKSLILGHSMGAVTTLALAGTYPDVPRAILLEDPPAWWMPDSGGAPDEGWQDRMRRWLTGLKAKTREQLIQEQRAAAPAWSEAELGPWADSKLRLHPNVFNRGRRPDVDWPALARRVTCPVLLITGDPEKGAIVKPEQAEVLREYTPQLRVAHVSGAGHSVRREGFDRYMEAVRAFLGEVTGPTG
jgi:pimeloyl-ACP methyl ester carboxylesterase